MQIKVPNEHAIRRRFPEQVAIAIVKDEKGHHDPITIGWTMLAALEPLVIALAIGRKRYALQAIRGAKEFCVVFPSAAMADDAMFFGTHSGQDMDKLALRRIKTQPATEIDSLLFTDAVANFECKLEMEVPIGDHVLVLGRVIAAHVHDDPQVSRLYSVGGGLLGGVKPV